MLPSWEIQRKAEFLIKDNDRFPDNTIVNVTFAAHSKPTDPTVKPLGERVCFIKAAETDLTGEHGKVIFLAAPNLLPNRTPADVAQVRSNLILKRLHAIAQRQRPGTNDSTSNVEFTRSSFHSVWGQRDNSITGDTGPGKLLPDGSDWLFGWALWTQTTTYQANTLPNNHEASYERGAYIGGFRHIDANAKIFTTDTIPNSYEIVDVFTNP